MSKDDRIQLAHGSGGTLMHELIETVVVGRLGNPVLNELDDSAEIESLHGHRLEGGTIALTTDSYVVQPLFFPGGDIGKLAVCGTVNDLAMKGARPAYLTLGLIAEEGLPLADLERVLSSIAVTAQAAGVAVAAGDTKVVERGAVGGLIMNTAGIGVIPDGRRTGSSRVKEGDAVIVSGTIGDHETAILLAREDLKVKETVESDCAPLGSLVEAVFEVCPDVSVMRDPTRGGLGTTLCEIASRAAVGITIDESKLPIDRRVSSVCGILGFDPIYMANEGKAVVIVPGGYADRVVAAMRSHELGRAAAVIGSVGGREGVYLRTKVGGVRPIVMLEGVQLPRIC
ncbi:MAG: hydrogenase expression/formation protein HypE [Candidatus Eisenbacteria bacterium]